MAHSVLTTLLPSLLSLIVSTSRQYRVSQYHIGQRKVLVPKLLTEMVAGSRVVVLLEGCVQTGVDSNLKICPVRCDTIIEDILYSIEKISEDIL